MSARPSAGAWAAASAWTRSAYWIVLKEIRVEWRSRQALGTTFLFCVCTLAAMAYALALKSVGTDVKAALLWIVLLFAALSGLARTFVREEELGTADGLRIAAPASAVLAGKLCFNFALLAALEAITTPLFLAVLPVPLKQANLYLLIAVLFLGGFGLAAAATFVAALVAQTASGGGRGALYFIAAFPVLMPCLMAAIKGAIAAFAPTAVPPGVAHDSLVVLTSYDVVVATAAFLLFGAVWCEC